MPKKWFLNKYLFFSQLSVSNVSIYKRRKGSSMAFPNEDLVFVKLTCRQVLVFDDARPLCQVQGSNEDRLIATDTTDEYTVVEGVGSHGYGVLLPESIEAADPMVAHGGIGHQDLVGRGLVAQRVRVVCCLAQFRNHSGGQNITAVGHTTHVVVVTIGIDATKNRSLW